MLSNNIFKLKSRREIDVQPEILQHICGHEYVKKHIGPHVIESKLVDDLEVSGTKVYQVKVVNTRSPFKDEYLLIVRDGIIKGMIKDRH